MSYTVTLENFTPLDRDDGVPWTLALIQEAPDPTAGPWTQIDSITLSPVDTDPTSPQARDLTTRNATIATGWYRVIWQDGGANQSLPTPAVSGQGAGARPTVQEVAALLRARTKVQGGKEIGTFTSATRPTGEEAENLIDMAMDEVLGKVVPIDPSQPYGAAYNAPGSDYERRTRRAIALYAAILVELSYFPEQVRNNQSPVSTYQQLYDSRIRALISEGETGRAEGMGEGGTGGGGGDAPADAAWSFPSAGPGALIGWASRW